MVVKGFLRDARVSGRETTNCKLTGEANNDFHLDLVSTKNAVKATAVTAEITPRLRQPGWDFDKLNFLGEEKFYVRVTSFHCRPRYSSGRMPVARAKANRKPY